MYVGARDVEVICGFEVSSLMSCASHALPYTNVWKDIIMVVTLFYRGTSVVYCTIQ